MPRERQAHLIAFDMAERGEEFAAQVVSRTPQLAPGVTGTNEAATRLASFLVDS